MTKRKTRSLTSSSISIKKTQAFAGPLPPPALLAQYDHILPGAAERIMRMAESQAVHRQNLETIVITGDSLRATLGLRLGFIIAVLFLLASVTLVLVGYERAGIVIGSVDIVGLATAFIYGSHSRKAERRDKAQQLDRLRSR